MDHRRESAHAATWRTIYLIAFILLALLALVVMLLLLQGNDGAHPSLLRRLG